MTEGLIAFLKTKTSVENLRVALAVMREFKSCESRMEWLRCPFLAWTKLEQLEEYLAHLVDGEPLRDDTIEYMKELGISVCELPKVDWSKRIKGGTP